jgi:hypothetical protein
LSALPTTAPIGTVQGADGKDSAVRLHPLWNAWVTSLQAVAAPLGNNGTTAQRPTGTAAQPLYIGQDYFDTTLGYKVTIKSLNPTVWVNGAGTTV